MKQRICLAGLAVLVLVAIGLVRHRNANLQALVAQLEGRGVYVMRAPMFSRPWLVFANEFIESSRANIVNFHYGKVSDDSVDMLSKFDSVQVLLVNDAYISNSAIQMIGRLVTLEHLELDGTNLTDEGVRALAGLRNLTVLRISETLVTDESVDIILRFPKLDELDVSDTKITSTGIERLRRAVKRVKW